jgi:hypothetical protein
MTPGAPILGCFNALHKAWAFVKGEVYKCKYMIIHILYHYILLIKVRQRNGSTRPKQ